MHANPLLFCSLSFSIYLFFFSLSLSLSPSLPWLLHLSLPLSDFCSRSLPFFLFVLSRLCPTRRTPKSMPVAGPMPCPSTTCSSLIAFRCLNTCQLAFGIKGIVMIEMVYSNFRQNTGNCCKPRGLFNDYRSFFPH